LIELPGHLEACEAETGDLLWKVDAAPGAVARGQELFYAEPGDALARIDVTTGEVRWKRRMRGAAHPARLWTLATGVLRSLPGEGLALVTDAGTLAFRAKLPGGAPREVAAVDRVLVAALASGSLAGIDPADGRLLWKRRCKASALHACGARALVLSEGALSCIDAQSGEPVWESEVPGEVRALAVAEGCALLLAHGELLSFALATGTPGAAVAVPWARHLTVGDEPETVVATGDDGAAARFEPNAFGPRALGSHAFAVDAPGPLPSGLGPRAWSLPPETGAPSAPAQLQRGVVLLQRALPSLHDAAEGFLLAELSEARAAVLAPDLSIALLHERELSVHRLTTHLSVL
jgi:hypothetical protein